LEGILLVPFVLLAAAGQHRLVLSGGTGLHGLPRIVVIFITAGTLTVGLHLRYSTFSAAAIDQF